jgi:hypothetical protein
MTDELFGDELHWLLSTPSRLVGELQTGRLHLQLVFDSSSSGSGSSFQLSTIEGPLSRERFLLSADFGDRPDQPEFVLPKIRIGDDPYVQVYLLPEWIAGLASLWFGKRFDVHGQMVLGRTVVLPEFPPPTALLDFRLPPFNHLPRPELGLELNLAMLEPAVKLLFVEQPRTQVEAFWAATRFYTRALRMFPADPEIAFFHFVVALEMIASQLTPPDDELYDGQALKDLAIIGKRVGRSVEARVRGRYFQLKRRAIFAAKRLVNGRFFETSEAEGVFRLTEARLEAAVAAAYDLRSNFAHTGAAFGNWFGQSIGGATSEMMAGVPVLPDGQQDLATTIAKTPTFVGLERLVRFVLLRFAHLHLAPLHTVLDDDA